MNTLQDRIRGSLIGGAIGDALGYPVEFIYSFEEIQARYGERGITRLDTRQHWLEEAEQTGEPQVKPIGICSDGYLNDSFGSGFFDESTSLSKQLM